MHNRWENIRTAMKLFWIILTIYYSALQIFYCMNVTDIDDKIIRRARQHHLFDEYKEKNNPNDQISKDVNASLEGKNPFPLERMFPC